MDANNLSRRLDAERSASVEFLKKIVSFDSSFADQGVTGKELEAQLWLEKALRGWGFETRLFEPDNEAMRGWPDFNPGHQYKDRPNLVAVLPGTGGGRDILLNGHIDTVPLDDIGKWTHHPLSGTIAGGRLHGRGACDMKAGLAAMIVAAKCVHDSGLPRKGNIVIESVVDEEGGGNGTLACIVEGYKADAAIVAEPTNLEILCASRGVFLLEVTVTGRSSHACFKWNGVNAIEKGMKIAGGLAELERRWLATRRHPLLPSPTITLGQIEGGISAATVPGTCVLRFDVKYLPAEIDGAGAARPVDAKEVMAEVEERIRNVCLGDDWLRDNPVALNWYLGVMPHSLDPGHPLVSAISSSCDAELGGHSLSGLPSGADARHLQNNGGMPTVLFGPGSLMQAHSIDEYVELDQYHKAIRVLAKTVLDWVNRDR